MGLINLPCCETLDRRTLFAGIPLYLTQTTSDAGSVLSIDGTPGDDRISVVATPDGLVIANKGGWSATVPDRFALLRVNGARGNDTVIVDGSVTTDAIVHGSNGDDTLLGGAGDDRLYGGFGRDRILGGAGDDTIVTIGDSVQDRVSGDAGADSFWTDANRLEVITDGSADEIARGAVHHVSAFAALYRKQNGGSPAALLESAAMHELDGQGLLDPLEAASFQHYGSFAGNPLFSQAGPAPTDVVQGSIGDCYLLAPLASLAQLDPDRIRQTVTELGDGTYAVRFHNDTGDVYYRVDSDLVRWDKNTANPAYAKLGAERSMWVAIIEKAYAFFRRGEGMYESINTGWMTEAYAALGMAPQQMSRGMGAPADLLAQMKLEFDKGASMTWGTYAVPAGIPLVSNHAYAIVAVNTDASGAPVSLVLRNPWGIDGAGDDGLNDGLVTLSVAEAQAAFCGVVYARRLSYR